MLKIDNLSVCTTTNIQILNNVSMKLEIGECIGLTGASGSGKSTLIKTIIGIDDTQIIPTNGIIEANNINVLKLSSNERRKLCGKTFGFIPQSPITSFFPNAKIGKQLIATIKLHSDKALTMKQINELAILSLESVNLKDTNRILNAYPCELSGGMLQRVTMAIILALKPKYILADEPTSALDNENAEILMSLLAECKNSGILFISHDVKALKTLCSSIIVMESGKVIENQTTDELFLNPQELWTKEFVHSHNSGSEVNKWIKLN